MSTTGDTPETVYEWGTRLLLAPNKGASSGLACQRQQQGRRQQAEMQQEGAPCLFPLLCPCWAGQTFALIQTPPPMKGTADADQSLFG